MRLLTVLAAALLCAPAHSHDYWGDGNEVDRSTKQLCCGQNDCLEIDPAIMHAGVDGRYHFDDTPFTILIEREMPSPDGRIWRCVWGGEIKCLFTAPRGS